MSVINNINYLESVRDVFEQAISVGDLEMARAALKDCIAKGFDQESATMKAELLTAEKLSTEDC